MLIINNGKYTSKGTNRVINVGFEMTSPTQENYANEFNKFFFFQLFWYDFKFITFCMLNVF